MNSDQNDGEETTSNGAVEQSFVPTIYHAPWPSMKCQYARRTKTKKIISEHELQFENGIFFADTPEKKAEMDACLADMPPQTRQLIKETSLEHAEQVAKQHQINHSREHRAISGPTTSAHLRDMTTSFEEAQLQQAAQAAGANVNETVQGAKNLFTAFGSKAKPEVKKASE